MKKNTATTISTLIAAGAISAWGHYYYYHTWLPKRRYAQLVKRMSHGGTVSGGFIDHQPHQAAAGDVYMTAYDGGLIIDDVMYAFTVAENGTVLHWSRQNVEASRELVDQPTF